MNFNTALSPEAVAAVKRVQALREFTKRTGFTTTNEQANELLKLNNEDLLVAAQELKFGGFGGAK
jgi:hypothetical protein